MLQISGTQRGFLIRFSLQIRRHAIDLRGFALFHGHHNAFHAAHQLGADLLGLLGGHMEGDGHFVRQLALNQIPRGCQCCLLLFDGLLGFGDGLLLLLNLVLEIGDLLLQLGGADAVPQV